jgi:hypothetical protein
VVVVDKQSGEAKRLVLSMHFMDVDIDSDVARLMPGGVDGDYYDVFTGIYHVLKNGKHLLPETDDNWTIEDFR